MIKFVSGDFFDFEADIRVNTVNCVGVMGAGVALAFKKRYPSMFADYVEQCKSGWIRPGKPSVWHSSDTLLEDITIVNFPTKDDWRKPSEYSYVESGLQWLSSYLKGKEGKIVTLPALGCGHGGLEWTKVKELIEKYLGNSPAEILVFEPSSSKRAGGVTADYSKFSAVFASVGIKVIDGSSPDYPASLGRFIERNLYVFPSSVSTMDFDFSLVCSSRPTDKEKKLVEAFLSFCESEKLSILLGSSAYEKKLAFSRAARGLKVGCFLPVGIYASAKKLKEKNSIDNLMLLSIGSPMDDFDKKEYLPSVLSRIFLAKKSLFLTNRLSWLEKYSSQLKKNKVVSYFYSDADLADEDYNAAISSGSKIIEFDDFSAVSMRKLLQ
ncbi:macro domain-containing protein [Pseudomonas citronellolis]|uniref:macro domain-containing protein n=1 Tax=Pseudomonas citronellolis TaxID=53408 RepID=UPI00226EB1AB|nr:macro domain-containing protein [Pseudomonas citronellolis]WAB90343.1 macro domain-containing protein [Pseudomonas citronellolis]